MRQLPEGSRQQPPCLVGAIVECIECFVGLLLVTIAEGFLLVVLLIDGAVVEGRGRSHHPIIITHAAHHHVIHTLSSALIKITPLLNHWKECGRYAKNSSDSSIKAQGSIEHYIQFLFDHKEAWHNILHRS